MESVSYSQMLAVTATPFTTVVQGEKGNLYVEGETASQPVRYTIEDSKGSRQTFECRLPGGGSGMFWEADAAAQSLRDGKLEADLIPHGKPPHSLLTP